MDYYDTYVPLCIIDFPITYFSTYAFVMQRSINLPYSFRCQHQIINLFSNLSSVLPKIKYSLTCLLTRNSEEHLSGSSSCLHFCYKLKSILHFNLGQSTHSARDILEVLWVVNNRHPFRWTATSLKSTGIYKGPKLLYAFFAVNLDHVSNIIQGIMFTSFPT